jgi:hypothetical protein
MTKWKYKKIKELYRKMFTTRGSTFIDRKMKFTQFFDEVGKIIQFPDICDHEDAFEMESTKQVIFPGNGWDRDSITHYVNCPTCDEKDVEIGHEGP